MVAVFWSIVAFILTGVIIWLIFTDNEKVKRILKWDDESQAAKAAAKAAAIADTRDASINAFDKPVEADSEVMIEDSEGVEASSENVVEEVAVISTAEDTEDAPEIEASRGTEIPVDVIEENYAVDSHGSAEDLQKSAESAHIMAEEAVALSGGTKIVVPTTTNFPDNLSKLNGIGEVYERRLYAAGIFTWHQIAETPVAKLSEITQAIDAANVDDWPGQARRLATDAGRTGIRYSGPMPDKLTAIPGIGEAAQQKLREHGIITYHQIAISPPEKVAAILGGAGKGADASAIIAKAKELA